MSWNKSYDVIIPAQVRFDYVLPMGAKLMYGDLCALAKDRHTEDEVRELMGGKLY